MVVLLVSLVCSVAYADDVFYKITLKNGAEMNGYTKDGNEYCSYKYGGRACVFAEDVAKAETVDYTVPNGTVGGSTTGSTSTGSAKLDSLLKQGMYNTPEYVVAYDEYQHDKAVKIFEAKEAEHDKRAAEWKASADRLKQNSYNQGKKR